MKNLMKVFVLLVLVASAGCKKKEDAPAPRTPHIAGEWSGNGTDNSIGYYDVTMSIVQSGDSASGTFTTVSPLTTTSGNVSIAIGPQGGNNLRSLSMARTSWTPTTPAPSRTCAGTMALSQPTFMTDGSISFYYTITDCAGGTNNGGMNLKKIAGTN